MLPANPDADLGKIPRKFGQRGFQFVPYLSQGAAAHGGSDADLGPYGGRYRTIGDAGVRKVSFEQYLDTASWEIPFATYFNAMKYIAFYETQDRTVSVPSLLERVDFPFGRPHLGPDDGEWNGANCLFDPVANDLCPDLYQGQWLL